MTLRRDRRWWFILVCVASISALVGVSVGQLTAALLKKKPVLTTVGGIDIRFPDKDMSKMSAHISPTPGWIVAEAEATIQHPVGSPGFCWYVEIRRTNQETDQLEVIFKQAYDHQVFPVPKGKAITRKFSDKFRMAPGTYNVYIGLREIAEVFDQQGNIVTDNPIISASSYWAEVQ